MEKMPAQHKKNQWLLFSLLQSRPVICSEYKAHIVAQKTRTHAPYLYDAHVAGTPTNPQEIGLNHKSVPLNWKKYGSVRSVFAAESYVT